MNDLFNVLFQFNPKNELLLDVWSNHFFRVFTGPCERAKQITRRTLIFHDRTAARWKIFLQESARERMRLSFLHIAWIRRSSIVSDGKKVKTGRNTKYEEENISSQLHLLKSLAKWRRVSSVFGRLSEQCKKKTSELQKRLKRRSHTPAHRRTEKKAAKTCSLHYWMFLLIGVKMPATLFSFKRGQRPEKRKKFIIN